MTAAKFWCMDCDHGFLVLCNAKSLYDDWPPGDTNCPQCLSKAFVPSKGDAVRFFQVPDGCLLVPDVEEWPWWKRWWARVF